MEILKNLKILIYKNCDNDNPRIFFKSDLISIRKCYYRTYFIFGHFFPTLNVNKVLLLNETII